MDDESLQTLLFELEQRLMAPGIRNTASAAEHLLAGEFVEFGSSGRVHDKASAIARSLAIGANDARYAISSCGASHR